MVDQCRMAARRFPGRARLARTHRSPRGRVPCHTWSGFHGSPRVRDLGIYDRRRPMSSTPRCGFSKSVGGLRGLRDQGCDRLHTCSSPISMTRPARPTSSVVNGRRSLPRRRRTGENPMPRRSGAARPVQRDGRPFPARGAMVGRILACAYAGTDAAPVENPPIPRRASSDRRARVVGDASSGDPSAPRGLRKPPRECGALMATNLRPSPVRRQCERHRNHARRGDDRAPGRRPS